MQSFRDIPIRRKLTAIIMATSISALFLASGAFAIKEFISLRNAAIKDLSTLAEIIGSNSATALTLDDKKSAARTLAALRIKPYILSAFLLTKDKKIFATYSRTKNHKKEPTFIGKGESHCYLDDWWKSPAVMKKGYRICGNYLDLQKPIFHDGERLGTIWITADLQELYSPLRWHTVILAIVMLISSLMAYLLSLKLKSYIAKPILNLAQTMKIVSAKKNYSIQEKKQSEDELGVLIDGFNEMLAQIQQRDAELEQHRNKLEAEVAIRTAELLQSNRNLEKTIDELKIAKEDLANAQALLTASIQQTPAGIIIADAPEANIRLVNGAAEEILGQPLRDQSEISLNNYDLIHWESYRLDGSPYKIDDLPLTQTIVNAKTIRNEEMRIVRQDGTERWILVNASPIRNPEGEIIAGIAVFPDITVRKRVEEEKKQLETQLQQSQKLEAIGTLAGGVAHEFNNLLQAIQGYTYLLLQNKKTEELEYNRLKEIENASRRAAELTQHLLTFSRKVESQMRPVDFNKEVIQVQRLLKSTIPRMINIELELAEDLKPIKADPAQIEQIILNLGLNARDAMPEGGKLIFRTENVTLDEEYCKTLLGIEPGEYVLLTVSDTGFGMVEEIQEHIFEPFYTTKEIGKGTGLGLAIVYGIVKSHQGYSMCSSKPGEGTTFKIYLPVLEEETNLAKLNHKGMRSAVSFQPSEG